MPPSAIAPGPQGQLARRQDLSLKEASPGEYVLVLTVRDEVAGRTLELREPFEVGSLAVESRATR
jgi:hypothetical protein